MDRKTRDLTVDILKTKIMVHGKTERSQKIARLEPSDRGKALLNKLKTMQPPWMGIRKKMKSKSISTKKTNKNVLRMKNNTYSSNRLIFEKTNCIVLLIQPFPF